jgi:8-oxo-dGTP pyrophosphatase MutT (NUDIX family)
LLIYKILQDFFADKYNNLPHYKTLKLFTELIITHCPQLRHLSSKMAGLFESFCSYKESIPVCGVIMLNEDMSKMVLVRNWKGTSWSFPRGKINQNESPYDCAMRETYEEAGFNPRAHCKEEDVLTFREKQGKAAKMYIASNVPEDTVFIPQTRKEISKVSFHDLDHLPGSNWGVLPFMEMLLKWIDKNYKASSKTGKKKKKKEDKRSGDKAEGAAFNARNESTFGDIVPGQDTWGVEDMFSANSKLTGRAYVYDGNPHTFGSVHPRFVNYNQSPSAGGAVGGTEAAAAPATAAAADVSAELRSVPDPLPVTAPGPAADVPDVAMQRDIQKIKAILRYLALPGGADERSAAQYAALLDSITRQRKMVKKVKEAGGVNITKPRMLKILNSTSGDNKHKSDHMSNASASSESLSEKKTFFAALDVGDLLGGVDAYLDSHYDEIEW